jgi:hypothetical protein
MTEAASSHAVSGGLDQTNGTTRSAWRHARSRVTANHEAEANHVRVVGGDQLSQRRLIMLSQPGDNMLLALRRRFGLGLGFHV